MYISDITQVANNPLLIAAIVTVLVSVAKPLIESTVCPVTRTWHDGLFVLLPFALTLLITAAVVLTLPNQTSASVMVAIVNATLGGAAAHGIYALNTRTRTPNTSSAPTPVVSLSPSMAAPITMGAPAVLWTSAGDTVAVPPIDSAETDPADETGS